LCDSSLRALRGGDVLVDCIVDVDVLVIAVDVIAVDVRAVDVIAVDVRAVDVIAVDVRAVDVDVLDCDCNDNGDSKGCPILGKAAAAAAAGTVVLRATMRLVVSRWHCCSQIAMAASQSARDSWYQPSL